MVDIFGGENMWETFSSSDVVKAAREVEPLKDEYVFWWLQLAIHIGDICRVYKYEVDAKLDVHIRHDMIL